MKRLKLFYAYFNYYMGWFFTNPYKLERMMSHYKKELDEAKKNIKK